jgi:hypothetical protein
VTTLAKLVAEEVQLMTGTSASLARTTTYISTEMKHSATVQSLGVLQVPTKRTDSCAVLALRGALHVQVGESAYGVIPHLTSLFFIMDNAWNHV